MEQAPTRQLSVRTWVVTGINDDPETQTMSHTVSKPKRPHGKLRAPQAPETTKGPKFTTVFCFTDWE